jgi:cytochrome c oxidase subunit 3
MSDARIPRLAVQDVSDLPDVGFGHRGHVWWGTSLFAVIEGSTIFISIFVYFYLRRNFDAWPPPRVLPPDLLIGSLGLLALLASLIPAWKAHQAAHDLDMRAVQRWQLALSVASAIIVVTRTLEFAHLNTRWDEHAYGSAVWILIGFHTTLMIVDILDTWVATVLAFKGPFLTKHFSDVEDGAFYWVFTVLIWIPVFVVMYLYPRWG